MYIRLFTALMLLVGTASCAVCQEAGDDDGSLLGWKMPFDLPELPELPPLPKGTTATEAMDAFVKQVGIALPTLKKLGYSIDLFDVSMVPPSATLRIQSLLTEGEAIQAVDLGADAGFLSTSLVEYARKAKSIQQLLQLKRVAIDVRLDVSPKMKMSFSDATVVNQPAPCGTDL